MGFDDYSSLENFKPEVSVSSRLFTEAVQFKLGCPGVSVITTTEEIDSVCNKINSKREKVARNVLFVKTQLIFFYQGVPKVMTLQPTEEQMCIVESLRTDNVWVKAVPGSGKTTTIKFIIGDNPERRILVLTYSKTLQIDTQKSLNRYSKHIDVKTIHGAAGKFTNSIVFNDDDILQVLKTGLTDVEDGYDIIVVDEVQDMNKEYMRFIHMVVAKQRSQELRLCFLGDPRQCIYEYKGADQRFLTLIASLYPDRTWRQCRLTKTMRLSLEMCNFLNIALGCDDIVTDNGRRGPIQIIRTTEYKCKTLVDSIYEDCQKYGPGEVLILAASVKSEWAPIKRIENAFIKKYRDVSVIASTDDEQESFSESVMEGKLACMTYHQSKGLTRKKVYHIGFDCSYNKYYNKDVDRHGVLVAPMYVSLTRASHELTLVLMQDYAPLPFITKCAMQRLIDNGDIVGLNATTLENWFRRKSCGSYGHVNGNREVSKIGQQLSTGVVRDFLRKHTIIEEIALEDKTPIKIKKTLWNQQNGLCEPVSAINGILVPAWYAFAKTRDLSYIINDMYTDKHLQEFEEIKTQGKELNVKLLVNLVLRYFTTRCGYKHPITQIISREWVSIHDLNKFTRRIDELLGVQDSYLFEQPVSNGSLRGVIDLDLKDFSVEFKTVAKLSSEHKLQAAIYSALQNGKPCLLFNIEKNEAFKITVKDSKEFLGNLDIALSAKQKMISDKEFIKKHNYVSTI